MLYATKSMQILSERRHNEANESVVNTTAINLVQIYYNTDLYENHYYKFLLLRMGN
jgi:hypothetical protein